MAITVKTFKIVMKHHVLHLIRNFKIVMKHHVLHLISNAFVRHVFGRVPKCPHNTLTDHRHLSKPVIYRADIDHKAAVRHEVND